MLSEKLNLQRSFPALLETVERAAWADLYRTDGATEPGRGDVRTEMRDGVLTAALGAVDILAFNRALGLGVESPVTEECAARMVEFYREAGCGRFFVPLSPSPECGAAADLLVRNGFRLHNAWLKLYRSAEPPQPAQSDLTVERIGKSRRREFARVLATAFDWPDTVLPRIAGTVDLPGWRHYLALDAGRPAATAALFVRGRAAWLDMAGTLPACRKRGAQAALLERRIRDAAALGCTDLVLETAEETPEHAVPSYRNALRFGFRVAYRRPNYLYEFPAAIDRR